MNVLPVQVGASQTLMLGERRLSVEGSLADALGPLEGQQLIGGIRAEQLRVAPATNRNLPAGGEPQRSAGQRTIDHLSIVDGNHLVQVEPSPALMRWLGLSSTSKRIRADGACSISREAPSTHRRQAA